MAFYVELRVGSGEPELRFETLELAREHMAKYVKNGVFMRWPIMDESGGVIEFTDGRRFRQWYEKNVD